MDDLEELLNGEEESTGSDENDDMIQNDVICDDAEERPQNYNRALPAEHSYLGTDMVELSGRVVHGEGSIITIPLLSISGVVLVPGQILPLQVENPSIVSMLKNLVNKQRTFGLCAEISPKKIGTTAEIRSFTEDASYGLPVVKAKAEGRQKFVVGETWQQPDGILMGKVTICPENDLAHPFRSNISISKRGFEYNYKLIGNITPFPTWVYTLYDPYYLMERIEKHLVTWITESENPNMMDICQEQEELFLTRTFTTLIKNIPRFRKRFLPLGGMEDRIKSGNLSKFGRNKMNSCHENDEIMDTFESEEASHKKEFYRPEFCPLEYSYWVAKNLPLEDKTRQQLLSIQSPIQRLRFELHLLENYFFLCCASCKAKICSRGDVFAMSLSGPLASYVNPAGQVHETLTVIKAENLSLIGRSSTEQSWFPGYAWTICNCVCGDHMGWKFTATNKRLQPESFWGITRSAIEPNFKVDPEFNQWKPII